MTNKTTLDRLMALRDRLGKPLIVRSGYRGPEHNLVVGGANRSKHLDCAAFDIALENHDPVAFEVAAQEVGFLSFGLYPRSGFIHVDLGPARQLGERTLVRARPYRAETRRDHGDALRVHAHLEKIHAGRISTTRTGDNSDVFVVDADCRRIPSTEVSRIDEDEMRKSMRDIVNRLYTFHLEADNPKLKAQIKRWIGVAAKWDAPEIDGRVISDHTDLI